jgi:protein-tyrosine phosphatase
MIDLHCHYLPGVDDGASSAIEALALARAAYENGIRHCLLTPHMHEGRYNNDLASLQPRLEQFRTLLESADLDLVVGLAAEVRFGPEVLDWLRDDNVPFLGSYEGRQVLLLELPHDRVPVGAERLVSVLLEKGVLPMIAHPERNKHVIRNLSALRPFVDAGCLLQLTSGSVTGAFGRLVKKRAVEMLERRWVHILATDAHNLDWRPPNLAQGRAAAAEIVGEEESQAMVVDRPWQLAREHFE